MSSASSTNPIPVVGEAWFRLWSDLFANTLEANRAAVGAFGRASPTPRLEPAVPEVAYREPDWSFERSVDSAADLAVGDWVRFTKRITDEEVRAFARISGDTNRLHLDDAFAKDTRFEGRIAHGTLVSGLISAALARLPGLTIYLSQDLEFRHPIRIGETVTGNCEVIEALGGDRYRVETTLRNEDDETIIAGEAVVLIDDLPAASERLT